MVSWSSQHIFPYWQHQAQGLYSLQLAPRSSNGETFVSGETLKIREGKEQTFQFFSGVMNHQGMVRHAVNSDPLDSLTDKH